MVKKLISYLILIFLLFSNSFLFFKVKEVLAITISPPINLPAEVIINQIFNLQGEIVGAQIGQAYYIKCRSGSSSSALNEGQTYNSTTNSWLMDTNAWVEMPYFEVNNNDFNFSFSCRVKSGVTFGDKMVFLRACLKQADGSCNNSFQSASGLNLKVLAEISPTLGPTPLSMPTPTPTIKAAIPTPTLIIKLPTPTPKPAAVYKINEVRDSDGEILNNVKVYVDDVYLHHYAPEVITFCDDCWCDGYISCGFGQHKIKLEKTGYDYWQEEKNISSQDSYEVNPVMIFSVSTLSLSPTPTAVIAKPTTFLTATPSLKNISSSILETTYGEVSQSGEILGEEIEAPPAFYPLEITDQEASDVNNNSYKNHFWFKLFFGSALVFLFFVSFWVWYNLRTRD